MPVTWKRRESWVAVFDILGFAKLVETAEHDFPRALLTSKLDDLLDSLGSEEQQLGGLEHLVFSDTIVIFSPSSGPPHYPWFLRQCKNLIMESIRVRLPLRGAISVGITFSAEEDPIVIGAPFSEAFGYCEDQDWIGLLLTPSATRALRTAGLDPRNHHFVTGQIPLRRLPAANVLAYRFQDGASNFESPLLPWLREMRQFAPDHAKKKYDNTITHINDHYRLTDG
jgi:hypothetical protein